MRTKKRWFLGTISGFFFGLFLSVILLFTGVLQLDSAALTILPVAGLLVGLGGSLWAPIPPRERPAKLEPEPVAPRAQGFAPPPADETPSAPQENPTED